MQFFANELLTQDTSWPLQFRRSKHDHPGPAYGWTSRCCSRRALLAAGSRGTFRWSPETNVRARTEYSLHRLSGGAWPRPAFLSLDVDQPSRDLSVVHQVASQILQGGLYAA